MLILILVILMVKCGDDHFVILKLSVLYTHLIRDVIPSNVG